MSLSVARVRPFAIAPVLVFLVFSTGCDDRPKRYKVSGSVTVDGAPLEKGIIQIIPEGARTSVGAIKDGQFTMRCYETDDGVIEGTHRVAINGSEPLGATKTKWHAPKKYSEADASGLTCTIEEERDDLTFELTWDGKKPYVENTGRSSYTETSDDI